MRAAAWAVRSFPCGGAARCVPARRIAIFLDLFLNACLGTLFAVCARDRLRIDGPLAVPAALLVLMFLGMIRLPMMLYLYLVHSAWSWHYLFDPTDMSVLALLFVALLQCGVLVGAWFLGAYFYQAHKRRAVLSMLVASALALVVMIVALSGRLTVYGSHKAFVAGETAGLMEVKLGYVLIALLVGLGSAAAYVSVELVRDSLRVRAL
jgi:hypothetical protein